MFSYNDVKAMTKPVEFTKKFKKVMFWRKAKGIIILADYKMGSRKMTIAIPYRKLNDAKQEYKHTIKGDNFPGLPTRQKILVGQMKIEKQADGTEKLIVKQIEGGASIELMNKKAGSLFEEIKLSFEVLSPESTPNEASQTADTSEHTTTSTEESSPASSNADIQQTAQAAKSIMQQIKNEWLPLLRANEITADYTEKLKKAEAQLQAFKTTYEEATEAIKNQLNVLYTPLGQMFTAIEKMLQQATNSTNSSNTDNEDTNAIASELIAMFRTIKTAMQNLRATAITNLKERKATAEDLKLVEEIVLQINDFEAKYSEANSSVQQQLAAQKEGLLSKLPQLETLAQKIKDALSSSASNVDTSVGEKIKKRQERIEQIQERIEQIREALAA